MNLHDGIASLVPKIIEKLMMCYFDGGRPMQRGMLNLMLLRTTERIMGGIYWAMMRGDKMTEVMVIRIYFHEMRNV